MEQHNPATLDVLMELGKFILALAGALFAYNRYIDARIQSIYRRMDEAKAAMESKIDKNHDLVGRDFVLKQVHDLEKKHQEEKSEDRIKSVVEVLTVKFDSLNKNLSALEKKLDFALEKDSGKCRQ